MKGWRNLTAVALRRREQQVFRWDCGCGLSLVVRLGDACPRCTAVFRSSAHEQIIEALRERLAREVPRLTETP